jgi:HEAT repeat protein
MGILDKFLGNSERIRLEWASDENLTCTKCGKRPPLKKEDVMPGITRISSSIFYPPPLKPSDKIEWEGKEYTFKKLQKIINETVYDRAVICTKCGKIFCVGCINNFGTILPNGEKGCPYCASEIKILEQGDSYIQNNSEESSKNLIGDKRTVKSLIRALKDKNEDVRERAAMALGKIGDERAVEPLIRALKDKDKFVRTSAAKSIGKIGDINFLVNALRDKDSNVREAALEALNMLDWGPRNVSEKINFLIVSKKWNEVVKLGEPSIEPLVQVLNYEGGEIRENAARALGEIGGKRAVESLVQALKDEDFYVREAAKKALKKLGKEKA